MNEWIEKINLAWQVMSGWEVVAVVLAIAYLVLAMKESIWCWHAALISTAIYTVLFWNVSLIMESALQIYYLLMAVYGWYMWRRPKEQTQLQSALAVHRWSLKSHLLGLSFVAVLTLVSGYLLAANTSAAWPYLDSFTTWSSVLTTYMVARKVLENWLYWLVIDSVSIFLYLDRGLYLTALLFLVYLIICVFGFLQWSRQYRLDRTNKSDGWATE